MPEFDSVRRSSRAERLLRGVLLASAVSTAVWCTGQAAHSAPRNGRLSWKPLDEPGSGGAIIGLAISPHDSRRLLVSGDMLGVGLSEDGGKSWQPTFGFTSWEMADFTFHPRNPNLVWVGSMSGPYLSRDGGRHWESRRTGMPAPASDTYTAPVEKILFDPSNPEHLLAFGGSSRSWHSPGRPLWGALWESRDGGTNWKRQTTLTANGAGDSPGAAGVNVNAAAFGAGSAPVLYAGARGHGLWGSRDGGKSWESRSAGLPSLAIERIVAHPSQPGTVFVSLGSARGASGTLVPGGVYKSTDEGRHWSDLCAGLSRATGENENLTARFPGFAVSSSNPDVMYVNDSAWNGGVIYGSRDGGKSWTALTGKGGAAARVETAYPAGLGLTVLSIDPRSPEHVLGGGTEFVVGTSDGGKSWTDLTAARAPGAAGWRGTGFSGLVATNFRWDPTDLHRAVFQAMDAGKFWLSSDGLKHWARPLHLPDAWGGSTDVSFAGKFIYVALGQDGRFDGIARSDDRGQTWKLLAGSAHGLPELHEHDAQPSGIYARPETPDIAWVCAGGKLYHTMDFGEHWKVIKTGPGVRWIARDLLRPLHFWISGERTVYETLDGEQFRAIGGPRRPGKVTVDSIGRLLLAADGAEHGGVWRYNGHTWSRLSDDRWTADVAVDPLDPDRIALTTNQNPYSDVSDATGIWVSGDGGRSWSQQNDGLAMLRGSVIRFNPSDSEELVWGSNGRGFWMTHWSRNLRVAGDRSYRSTAEDERFAAQILP